MKRKGISVFTSHILAIAILFMVLIVTSTQLYNYYYNVKEKNMQSSTNYLFQEVSNNIIEIHSVCRFSDYTPKDGENITLSSSEVNIPEKISGNNYILSLENHGENWISNGMEENDSVEKHYAYIVLEVLGKPSKNYGYPVYNIVPTNVSGSVRQTTKIILSCIRENNSGKINDTIFMERVL